MNSLKFIWQKNAPFFIQNYIKILTDNPVNKKRRKNILRQFHKTKGTFPKEIVEAIQYLKKNRFTPFPYNWSLKYEYFIPKIYVDSENSFYYIIFEGKKLYFPKKYTRSQVLWTTRGILKEQDTNSAHLYLTEKFQIENDSILIDAGVAEGSFSLSAIEKVKKLFLIECEPDWLEALELTFKPWKNKVEIIGKYLSDSVSDNMISIDGLIKAQENEKYFFKFDVEGYEKQALNGMKVFFSEAANLKMSVATYHRVNDANEINDILTSKDLKCHFSDSYLVFTDENENTSFRKAIIRAEKTKK
jgi:hypothetical protein